MGCPKIVPLCSQNHEPERGLETSDSKPIVPGAAGTQSKTMEDKQAYKNNRLDYHAAGSYDVCRFNTRM